MLLNHQQQYCQLDEKKNNLAVTMPVSSIMPFSSGPVHFHTHEMTRQVRNRLNKTNVAEFEGQVNGLSKKVKGMSSSWHWQRLAVYEYTRAVLR